MVVNYRGAADTVTCVTSLLASTYGAQRVVVVDNDLGSGDVEVISRRFGDRIDLVMALAALPVRGSLMRPVAGPDRASR